MPPDLAPLSTLNGSNYPCLELIFMVPKVFEPLKFDCIMHHYKILMHEEPQRSENQMRFCPNLLTSRMRYDVNRCRHLTNSNVVITVNVSISQSSPDMVLKGIA